MPHAIFTYGTLMFPAVMGAVTGHAFACAEARLRDFSRQGIRDEVFPGIVATPGSFVDGVVWFDVDDPTLSVLDEFEDGLYERRDVRIVASPDGEARGLSAQAWVIPAKYADALDGRVWDPARFEAQEMARYVEMCRRFAAVAQGRGG